MKLLPAIFVAIILGSSLALAEPPAKEKMLVRYILQNEFLEERARLSDSRKELAETLRSSSFADALAGVSGRDDAAIRKAFVLSLGISGFGDYDSAKVREALKRTVKSERDKWIRLEMARVLASLGDGAGKDVLVSALTGKEGYMTQSGIEVGKAVLPLLLLDYDFPDGFPKRAINYEWGGLQEYFDAMRKGRSIKSPEPTAHSR